MRCQVEVAPLRAAPGDDTEQVSQALLHEPLAPVERRHGWLHVETAYGYRGWIRATHVEEMHGTLPEGRDEPLAHAQALLGAPYEWGGMTGRGIDCSGLVHIAYRLSGRLVPRDAWQQEEASVPVAAGDERPGDVRTYGKAPRADHIAFWVGGGRILHSTGRDGLGVIEEDEPMALREAFRAHRRL